MLLHDERRAEGNGMLNAIVHETQRHAPLSRKSVLFLFFGDKTAVETMTVAIEDKPVALWK